MCRCESGASNLAGLLAYCVLLGAGVPQEVAAIEFPGLIVKQAQKMRQLLSKHSGGFADMDFEYTNMVESEIPVLDPSFR